MTTYAEAELPQLLPGMTNSVSDTRAVFAVARATAPLARGLFGPLAIHHRDVTELLRDRRLRGPGMDFARLSGIPEGSRAWERQAQILLFMEGDDHHRLRRLVAKAFTPRSVEALRPFTRSTIARLVDAVIDEGSCDAVPALCDPFPIPVICALVGIEADRLGDMSRWAYLRWRYPLLPRRQSRSVGAHGGARRVVVTIRDPRLRRRFGAPSGWFADRGLLEVADHLALTAWRRTISRQSVVAAPTPT